MSNRVANRSKWTLTLRASIAIASLFVGGFALGHDSDPKALDLQPPYIGAGYRSGIAAGGPPGMLFPSTNISFLAWITLGELDSAAANANDCWGYTSPSGREYAIVGTSTGTTFVEVTNPGNPQLVGTIPGNVSLWRDIKVYQSYAYSVTEGLGGIQVIDLQNIDSGSVALVNTVDDVGSGRTHNVAIDETSGFLYRCGGGSNGLRIYDLSTPATPTFVGEWQDRYVHDACIVTYPAGSAYAGQQIAFACGGLNGGWDFTGVTILDVTDKANIVELFHFEYPNAEYCHQAWPAPDLQYLYVNDELDEQNQGVPTSTRILDISDLSSPQLVGTFTTGTAAVDHNLYTVDNYIYEANYRSGLRVFDASDPTAPVEIATFDTYPEDDAANFNSLWNVYPYFPSGTVIGSDMEKGLFVWRLGDLPLTVEFPLGQPSLVTPYGTDSLTVQIVEQSSDALLPGSVELNYDVGGGFNTISMTDIGSLQFEATWPAFLCGDTVSYYITAQTVSGYDMIEPFTSPFTTFVAPVAAGLTESFDDLESGAVGWSAGVAGDDATTGIWTLGDPNATLAQPEDDHTATGVTCWFTGQTPAGGLIGDNDVDGGTTTLVTPTYALDGLPGARIDFWFWYSNAEGTNDDDTFVVEITDDGSTWIEVLNRATPTDGWELASVTVSDYVTLTDDVQLRFVASDLGAGSIVEAAVDDVTLVELFCDDCNTNGVDDSLDIALGTETDCNSNGIPDSCDISAGTSLDVDGDETPDECQCPVFFIRGDTNGDASVDVSDAVSALTYLFDGGMGPNPIEVLDVNGDGSENVADVVYLLEYLFGTGAPPVAPFPNLGCP